MCLNPRTISRKDERMLDLPRVGRHYAYRVDVVPCGKCCECLRKRQNVLTHRIAREIERNPKAYFVTLTYREDTVPISIKLLKTTFDVETGEEFAMSPAANLQYNDCVRGEIIKMPRKDKPRIIVEPFSEVNAFTESNGEFYSKVYTPSLRRKDVRLWIKRCRVRYERKHKCKLVFRYFFTGEMGPRTCRPHYHAIFIGLEPWQIAWMLEDWQKVYGYTDCRRVKLDFKNGRNPFYAIGRYLGKYVVKGKYECSSVKEGLAEKPRICQSVGFGNFISDSLRNWYYGVDVVGKYDTDKLVWSDGRIMTDEELGIVSDIILRRQYFKIFSKDKEIKLPLGRTFKSFIYGYFTEDGRKMGFTQIYRFAMETARGNALARAARNLSALSSEGEISRFCSEVAAQSESISVSALSAEALFDKNQRSFYERSVF